MCHPVSVSAQRVVGLALLAAVCSTGPVWSQDDNRRAVTITARESGFTPARIEVRHNDIVHVTFVAEDAAHSFNLDAYRIAKRARAGETLTFEFRADQAGRFPYYCSLTAPRGQTHEMQGELVVRR